MFPLFARNRFAVTSTRLIRQIDDWTVQALVSVRYLASFYRRLKDDRQATTALQAVGSAEERARRLRLEGRVIAEKETLLRQFSDETDAEATAWQSLIEAQAGIYAFHALVEEDPDKSKPLRAARIANMKAFRKALAGLRTAFPEAMAQEGIARAVHAASKTSTDLFVQGLESLDNGGQVQGAELRKSLYQQISDALMTECAR